MYIKYRTQNPNTIYKHIFALSVSRNVTAHYVAPPYITPKQYTTPPTTVYLQNIEPTPIQYIYTKTPPYKNKTLKSHSNLYHMRRNVMRRYKFCRLIHKHNIFIYSFSHCNIYRVSNLYYLLFRPSLCVPQNVTAHYVAPPYMSFVQHTPTPTTLCL